jgi:transposase
MHPPRESRRILLLLCNRRVYLVSQYFAAKSVEHLLGAAITAEMLHDDCLGRTLDWLYTHDPTALFAGMAWQARQRCGLAARQIHVDSTSFPVTGEYDPELDAQTLAITYGYSREHRADLKQWMLALATTRAGGVPLFCQVLDGTASDTVGLVAAVEALAEQLRTEDEEEAPISWRTAVCTAPRTLPASPQRACGGGGRRGLTVRGSSLLGVGAAGPAGER